MITLYIFAALFSAGAIVLAALALRSPGFGQRALLSFLTVFAGLIAGSFWILPRHFAQMQEEYQGAAQEAARQASEGAGQAQYVGIDLRSLAASYPRWVWGLMLLVFVLLMVFGSSHLRARLLRK